MKQKFGSVAHLSLPFDQPPPPPWRITEAGSGSVRRIEPAWHLTVAPTPDPVYSNAQISDYAGRSDFRWRPPLRLTVTARASSQSHHLRGTAGFGFWNHPFVPGEFGFRLPQAVWFFFGSPPNDMPLARGLPGHGWKAATIDATRPLFLALLPTAPLGFLLMRFPALYNRLWPVGQHALGVSECLLDPALLPERHTYTLDWQPAGVVFAVDGVPVHHSRHSPRGPLGLIAWIDNQYAVVTPQGRFGWGLVPLEREQSLILEQVEVKTDL
jgi:hypothetical protein